MHRIRASIAEKSWVGLDLDDTLHEFRQASSTATDKCLETVSRKYGVPFQMLKDEYSRILRERTSGAFSDGKTSFEYRRERFASLLEQACQGVDPAFVEDLLTLYEDALTESLRLKPGALSLLTTWKGLGRKIAVITEGPQDAQERTIQCLGIAGQIDFLATTNHVGVSKVDGLFPKVLRHLGISPQDMVYIGDSEARDMAPAMAEGIFCIHFDEAADVSLGGCPPKINEMRWLEAILTG